MTQPVDAGKRLVLWIGQQADSKDRREKKGAAHDN